MSTQAQWDTDERWRDRAACAGKPLVIFFPPISSTTRDVNKADLAAAREICLSCPVRPECLDWALRSHDYEGILGGTTGKQRRSMRRKRVWVP